MTHTLERRLELVEKKLYGHTPPTPADSLSCSSATVPFLTGFAQDLGNAVNKRERVQPILRKCKELESFLDPRFGEDKGLPTNVKVDLILAQEDRIRETGKMLEIMKDAKVVLDKSDELERATTTVEGKLAQLAKIHINQCESGKEICQETLLLMKQYNDIIESISKSFIQYDALLTTAEGDVMKKKGK